LDIGIAIDDLMRLCSPETVKANRFKHHHPFPSGQCNAVRADEGGYSGGYSDRSGYTRPRLSAIQEESIGSYGLGGFVGGIFKDRLFRIEME